MRIRIVASVLASVVLASGSARAQAPAVSGKWTVDVGQFTSDDDQMVQVETAPVWTLVLTQGADSVRGTWQSRTDTPADSVRGVLVGKTLKLKGVRNGSVSHQGTTPITYEIELNVEGDRATGLLRLFIPGISVKAELKAKQSAAE